VKTLRSPLLQLLLYPNLS